MYGARLAKYAGKMASKSSRFAVLVILAVSCGFAAAEAACGSDQFTAGQSTDDGGTGGGPDGASVGDSGSASDAGDAGTACIVPPAGDLGETAFCQAYAAIATRCLDCDPCWQVNANNCGVYGKGLSDAFKNAIVTCQGQIRCDEFESQVGMVSNTCVQPYFLDAGVTTAQLAAAGSYCDVCTDAGMAAGASCPSFFQSSDGDGGFGDLVLLSSDPLVDKIDTDCDKASACSPAGFFVCSTISFCGSIPKDVCKKGFCK